MRSFFLQLVTLVFLLLLPTLVKSNSHYYTPYIKVNGSCPCGYRQYWAIDTCEDVSDRCDSYNPFTGRCTSCIPGYSLTHDGECI